MFETSVIQARAQAAGGRLSLLTVSIVAHSAVVIGAIAMSIASTEFPTNAPKEFALAPVFMPVRIPPPLGVPNGGAKPQAQPQQPQRQAAPAPQPYQLTAPQTVPDTIPAAEPASSSLSTGTGDPAATSTEPLGVPWGTKDSLGDLDAPPSPITNALPEPEKIYEVYEVKAPVPLSKPHPPYPSHLIRTRMPATVVVRCVIDKNGRVRDPRIVVSAMPPFNKSVLDTITTWRYTPGSRNGIAVETYLDVTVKFSVN